jgi:hypothetical protein
MTSKAPNSVFLVEDIIHLTKIQEQQLRTKLNYDAHHYSQRIVYVSHQIFKTSIYSMLSFFHYIIFTSKMANVPIIRHALGFFKIDKIELDLWMEQFKTLGKGAKEVYFYFDCEKHTFNMSKNIEFTDCQVLGTVNNAAQVDDTQAVRKILQQKFDKFLEGHPKKVQASAIFSIIINCINVKLIREHDLTFSFKSKLNHATTTKISLVDYVTTLLTEKMPVNQRLKVLNKYILNYCYIPKIFMLNKNF